jgi:hypothetical protein
MTYVFISYAREDNAYVLRLVKHLGQHGIETWMDDHIPTGQRWQDVVFDKVRESAAFVVLMSGYLEKSQWVIKEVVVAELGKIPILLLSLSSTRFPILTHLQAEAVNDDILPSDKFLTELVRAIERGKSNQGSFDAGTSATPLGDLRRQADLRLLEKLWKTINSENLNHLIGATEQRSLYETCFDRFLRYREYRARNPEFRFDHLILENLFSPFDSILGDFLDQVIGSAQFNDPRTPGCIWPHYIDVSTTYRPHKEQQWNEVLATSKKLGEEHHRLVTALKRYFPEFDFHSEFNCNDEA